MRLSLTTFLLLVPAGALAAESDPMDPLTSGLEMMAALGVVLGVVLLLYFLVRKKTPAFFGPARQGAIKVLETRHLGPRKSLCLVRVKGEDLLLGVCQDRIELLARPAGGGEQDFSGTLDSALEAQR